jgi:hypothetical protein
VITLLFSAAAHAHPSAVPHVHPSDPAAFWIVAAWAVAAIGWAGWALHSAPTRAASPRV